jgi:hypothetical protein
MDLKSVLLGMVGGSDAPNHPNFASRPAVTYDVTTRSLVYNQNGIRVHAQVPLGRAIAASGGLVVGDETTILVVDTLTGAATITLSLPTSPTIGDTYFLLDSKASWGTYKVTLATNTFFGTSGISYDLKLQSALATVRYISPTIGWVVYMTASPVSAVPSGAAPLMNSVAASGVSTAYSREDHIHPTDTTLAPINSPSFTGSPTVGGVPIIPLAQDVQVITIAGANTWTKPTNAKMVEVFLCAGGGGGASGSKGVGTVALSGGGGGGAGAVNRYIFPASTLAATCTVTIGAGGIGGAAVSAASTNGSAGGGGGGTSFVSGSISVRSNSVGGATVGTYTGGGNTTISANGFNGTQASVGGSTAASALSVSLTGSRGTDTVTGQILPGLAGASIGAGSVGTFTPAVNQVAHGASAGLQSNSGSVAVPGQNGVGLQIGNMLYAFGGSGGSSSIVAATNAVSGGAGIYGSGGGGGGAALDSAGNSGAGGNGGNGWAIIITTY